MWRVRKPLGHPRWFLLNTQGIYTRQSSCELPRPVKKPSVIVSRSIPFADSISVISFEVAIWRLAYLLGSNGLLAGLVELLNGLLVVTQILLATNKNDGETAAEMKNFGDPLYLSTCQ